ncbi:type II secretion system F family protein [Fimbriimonas ginsengisoli]|uniref:Type IV pilus assembly protein PilC n=1 Tax=Fimbriimonas ginsengisoli Gsoil 348 TaxID=661478 RepID=A0A068NXT6_FIMGI|nr:type II secretion system F family protein [Fimbriimonas ginsengisoli]AIE87565.1 type IV pilus assembly protein PilC [Fimbriimonas ginsengisoli Gsoil 348]
MTTFSYVALEPSGQKKTGFVDASSREAAIQTVSATGRFVLDIKEEGTRTKTTSAAKHEVAKRKGKVSRGDLALFTRRLADLSEAGLPLDRVLQVVSEQSESITLTEVAENALDEVRGGKPVSDALAAYPKLFPSVFTQTLKAGEASGQFPDVTSRLANFQENEVARRSQITSALVYPGILASTAVFVVVFLLTFVVPRLSGVFKGLGNDLPASTKLLLAMTAFITQQWYFIIGGIVAAVVLYKAWAGTESGRYQRDALIMRMPAVGPVIRKATVSRFSRVLATLVFGGVPILQALNIAGLASGNRVFQRSAEEVEAEVREGVSIAQAMRDAGAFPPVLTHMVAIGEETGDLPKMLNRVSDSLDFEVDNGMRRLTAMVEPIIVLTMGVFVGFVVLSVLLPIYAAGDTVK